MTLTLEQAMSRYRATMLPTGVITRYFEKAALQMGVLTLYATYGVNADEKLAELDREFKQPGTTWSKR